MSDKPRALVIDDDPAWQQILEEILTDYGFAVDLGGGLDEGVMLLQEKSHRVAVVDLSLGGEDPHNQDGLDALAALQRHDPTCVSVLLTGYATVELTVRALREFGALAVLRKENFQRSSLVEWVDEALLTAPASVSMKAPSHRETNWPEKKPQTAKKTDVKFLAEAIIVEDDAGWRVLLTELAEEEGFRVSASSSYIEAVGLLKRNSFDLGLVDLSLSTSLEANPNQDGYGLLSRFQAAETPVIVISGYAEPEQLERAFDEFDLLAFMEKQSFDREAFLRTIRKVLLDRRLAVGLDRLTPRELEVLSLLASGATNKEIASRLDVSENTVKRHLKSIFAKLNVNSRAAATAWAMTAGLTRDV